MGEVWNHFLGRKFYELLSCTEVDIQMFSYEIQSWQGNRVRSNVFSEDSDDRVDAEAKETFPPSPGGRTATAPPWATEDYWSS